MGGYVYAIGIEGTDFIKIGQAKNPRHRMAGMQTGLPFRLELIYQAEIKNPSALEKCLHNLLIQYKERGEWFHLSREEIPSIFSEAAARMCQIDISRIEIEARSESFNDRLRRERIRCGLGVRELERRAGIPHGIISRLERIQNTYPSVPHAMKIANVLGITLQYLLVVDG